MKLFEGFLNTLPLWKQEQFNLQQFRLPEVKLSKLTLDSIPSNLRLGHQVEFVFLQILEAHPDYKILAHSLQIKKKKITIGELDFLIKHKEQVYHLELSCKFYLIDPDIPESVHKLVGPNRGDVFSAKLNKTITKQLPLLYSKECLNQLKVLDIDVSKVKQQVYFISQLFTPINMSIPSIYPLNKQCIKGFWLRMKDFEEYSFRESEYYIPYKSEWLYNAHNEVLWKSYSTIVKEISLYHNNKRSPMLWRKLPNGDLNIFFVTWW